MNPLRRHAATLFFGALVACAGPAGADERKILIIQGRTLDQDHFPLGDVKIAADGSRTNATRSDRRGEFALRLTLPDVDALRKKPFEIRISPRRGGWRLALPEGEPVIGLQLAIVSDAQGNERCVARSNHPRVAAAAARAVGTSNDVLALAAVTFVGIPGRDQKRHGVPALTQVAKVSLAGVSPWVEFETPGAPAAPEPAAVVADLPAPAVAAAATTPGQTPRAKPPVSRAASPAAPRPAQATVSRPPAPRQPDARERARREWAERAIALEQIRAKVRAEATAPLPAAQVAAPAVAVTAALAPVPREGAAASSCACRVEGTVELDGPPLAKVRSRAVVASDAAAVTDTVELIRGRARAFSLGPVPCGTHRVELRGLDPRLRLVNGAADRRVRCDGVATRRLRLVVRPG